ncbi:Hypothetical_protein [Hexamita inflata]|uniref:Hypothetical_protein n=1 Tax=Hexamita inflata TaxID=28002 RepID=A0AA86Q7U1_9EUKA|nr:Hypothetical protein HINF_LOCUS39956 [Hexamita inflata]
MQNDSKFQNRVNPIIYIDQSEKTIESIAFYNEELAIRMLKSDYLLFLSFQPCSFFCLLIEITLIGQLNSMVYMIDHSKREALQQLLNNLQNLQITANNTEIFDSIDEESQQESSSSDYETENNLHYQMIIDQKLKILRLFIQIRFYLP